MALSRTGVPSTLRAEMARRGLTQRDVAKHLGISQAAVSSRIRGETAITVDELAACAELFGMTLAELTALAEPVSA